MIASATDITLKPAPITPEWVREGNPQARNAVLSRSADGMATTLIWECTAGKFDWTYHIDETIYFLEGSAVISDGHAPPRRFGAGDVLFLPHGTVAHWHVEEYVRKVAFCRKTQPKLLTLGLKAARRMKKLATPLVAVRRSGEGDALSTALTN